MSTISNLIFNGANHKITSTFGYRESIKELGGTNTQHNGTDYGTYGLKIPQYAIEDGYVFAAEKSNSDGANYVWVIYPRVKLAFLHYHLDSITIKAGAKVKKGTELGKTGMTGKATGIHLHLGVRDLKSLSTTQINNMTWALLRNCQYIDAESITYAEPTVNNSVENVNNSTTDFKVGDTVRFTGNTHYISADSTSPKKCIGGLAQIRQIYRLGSSRHPYLLVRLGGDGATVWGWVDTGTFSKPSSVKAETKPVETKTTETKSTSTKEVKASEPAKKGPDSSLCGTYTIRADGGLHIRDGAGTTKQSFAVLPNGSKVTCYGFYSLVNKIKWLYVVADYNGVKYSGFVCSTYLSR